MSVSLKTLLALLVTVLLAGGNNLVQADSPTTLAVLNPDELVVASRLAARLGNDDAVRVVERPDAGAIIPSPDVDEPAEVLVVVHVDDADATAIDLVVCETRHGLRLASGRVQMNGDVVKNLASVVEQGLRKRTEPIEKVIGVIPFRDDSLMGRGRLLAASATRAVEEHVLSIRGTFLLEASRAYAIHNELRRSRQQKITKPLARSYLLGNCRIDGPTTRPSVWCDVILMQRGVATTARVSEARSVEDGVAAIVSQAREVLANGPASAEKMTESEVDFLSTQADKYAKSGRWRQAIECAETALLIDPTRNEMRRIAAQSLAGLVKEMRMQRSPAVSSDSAFARRRWNYLRRGMAHYELYLRGNSKFDAQKEHGFASCIPLPMFTGSHGTRDARTLRFIEKIQEDARQALLRVVRDRAEVGNHDERNLFGFVVMNLPPSRKWQIVEQIILDTQNIKGAESRTKILAKQWFSPNVLDAPEAKAMLTNLEEKGNLDVKAAVASLRRENEAFAKRTITPPPKRPLITEPVPDEDAEVRFEELKLKMRGADGNLVSIDSRRVSEIVAAGEGIDIACTSTGVYALKKGGILVPIWRAQEQFRWFTTLNGSWPTGRPCFDGRYVWACAHYFRGEETVLLMIDPINETCRSLSAKDGLPLPLYSDGPVTMTPVEPGRICLAAGGSTSFLAMASVNESNDRLNFNIFHEASDQIDEQDDEQWRSSTLKFQPMYMFKLTSPEDGGRPERQIFVGRFGDIRSWRYPLQINPDTLEVSVFTDIEIRPGPNSTFGLDGQAMYWCMPTWRPRRETSNPDMYRVGFYEFTKQKVASKFYSGPCQSQAIVFHDGKVHVVADAWVVAPSVAGPFKTLRGSVPGARGTNPQTIFRSSHYGLVLRDETRNRVYAVRFVDQD